MLCSNKKTKEGYYPKPPIGCTQEVLTINMPDSGSECMFQLPTHKHHISHFCQY